MRKTGLAIAAVWFGLAAAPLMAQTTVVSAKRIHTMDGARPTATAISGTISRM